MTNISTLKGTSKKKKFSSKGNKWFYIALIALPIIQCTVFTLYVYVNSFAMAFQEIDPATNKAVGITFDNFVKAFQFIGTSQFGNMVEMSLLRFVCHIGIGVPLGVLFAYYISKKRFGAGFFRVLLFLPSIIPAIVLVTIFKNFVDRALPAMSETIFGVEAESLFSTTESSRFVIIFYNVFIGFGASVLMYANKMSQIDPSLQEAANLDGANSLQEFWHVALPSTYSTMAVFLYTSIASIFLDQLNLFSFYGWSPEAGLESIGYYFFYQSSNANTLNSYTLFSEISAFGLVMTCIAIPLTFLAKFLLEKFGPSED